MTRRGMTLVEMMVATTATLILMAAVAQVFSVFGSALSDSRSMVELDARMRTVASRLRTDLSGATARPLPPLDPQAGEGYFEIIEGPLNDLSAPSGTTALAADTDDVLLFTTRNSDIPFIGKTGTSSTSSGFVESTVAEVIWFLRPTVSNTSTFTLYRRQLLVVGLAGFEPFASLANTATTSSWSDFYENHDISARAPVTSGTMIWSGTVTPNTLTDLTRRECRFLHTVTSPTFPFAFVAHQSAPAPNGLIFTGTSSKRIGEDVILTNVLSFDVRVFDPVAPVDVIGDAAVGPGDQGASGGTGSVASGAYVDLGNGSAAGPSGPPVRFSTSGTSVGGTATLPRTYDTWSTHYESNGVNEDGDALTDEGSDGLDNNNDGQVDEIAEQETSPPYPYPLRGIEVRIRCYEPSSKQVRQVTVRHTFVPH